MWEIVPLGPIPRKGLIETWRCETPSAVDADKTLDHSPRLKTQWTDGQGDGKWHVWDGMTTRSIVGIIALTCASVCGIFGSFLNFQMIDKVNNKLPEEGRFEWFGWNLLKYQKLIRDYRMFYPDGQLLFRVRLVSVLLFVWMLVCAWGFRFFAR